MKYLAPILLILLVSNIDRRHYKKDCRQFIIDNYILNFILIKIKRKSE